MVPSLMSMATQIMVLIMQVSHGDAWGVRSIGTTLAPIVRTPSTTYLADWETLVHRN